MARPVLALWGEGLQFGSRRRPIGFVGLYWTGDELSVPLLVKDRRPCRGRPPRPAGAPAAATPGGQMAKAARLFDARRNARLALVRKPLTLWHATGTATRYRRAPRR